LFADFTLEGFVGFPSFGSFHFNGCVAVLGEVVNAGSHIEFSGGEGELKTSPEQITTDPWHGFGRPFVKVHVAVEAGRLFKLLARFESWGEFIESLGGGWDESDRIEVTAAQRAGFDEVVDFFLTESEWGVFAMAVVATPVNHRPLVHSETGKVAGSGLGGDEEVVDVFESVVFFFAERFGCEGDDAFRFLIMFSL